MQQGDKAMRMATSIVTTRCIRPSPASNVF
jgi:hypothetical protein